MLVKGIPIFCSFYIPRHFPAGKTNSPGEQGLFVIYCIQYYYFSSSTTTDAGGNFTCRVLALRLAPLNATGVILLGLSNEL